jgi:hypothetical protein
MWGVPMWSSLTVLSFFVLLFDNVNAVQRLIWHV